MFLYIKTNILRGYGIFKNDFAHPREPANASVENVRVSVCYLSPVHSCSVPVLLIIHQPCLIEPIYSTSIMSMSHTNIKL